jgi:hypothetical protein
MSANGVPLPAHCQIDGIINKRTGIDGYPYGDDNGFEVRSLSEGDNDEGLGAAVDWLESFCVRQPRLEWP